MDLILLIALSNVLAGKFRKANIRGVGKYILGMIGTVLVCELTGLMITSITESFVGLLICMLAGVIFATLIFRAGAKKAAAGEQQEVYITIVPLPVEIRASAIVCAVGAFLTGAFGWLLTSVMSPKTSTFIMVVAKILRTRNLGIFFFTLMGIGTLVLTVGYFMMASLKKPGGNIKETSLFCAFTTLAYSVYLFYSAASYVKTYVMMRSLSMLIPFYIPLIITIIATIAVFLHLTSLYERLAKTGRVLAAVAMLVFMIVLLLDIYTLIILKTSLPMRRSLHFSWYGSSVLGYWLLAFTMLMTTRKTDDVSGGAAAMPE